MSYPQDLPTLGAAQPIPIAVPLMPQHYANPGMSLTQLTTILLAYWKQSVLIAAVVVFAAGAACMLLPRTYESTAALMVNFEVNDPLGGREFPIGLLGSYMSTQVELARGSEVLLTVIDRLKLATRKEFYSGYSGDAAGLPDFIVTRLQKNLLVEQGLYGSQLIHVTYSAPNPVEAAQIANAVGDVYSEQQYQRTTGPAAERAKRYTEQLAELKQKLTDAQAQVTNFRQGSGLVNADARTDVDMHTNLIESLKAQLATQNSQMAQLRPTLGARHPQVLELQSQINATNQSLNTELNAYSHKAKSELIGTQYQLELQAAQAVYARALDGYDQVKFAAGGGYTNINIISRATPSSKPSKPKIKVALLLAVLVGGALGLFAPLCYELLNRRVRCRDDIERDHGIPVLAELGLFGSGSHRSLRVPA